MVLAIRRWRAGAGASFQARACWTLATSILLLLVAVGLVGLWLRDDSLARVRSRGAIRIPYAVELSYAFLRPDGQVTGQDPEVARVIAAQLGINRVEWRPVEFGALINGLNAGHYDVVAAGIFVTQERQQRVEALALWEQHGARVALLLTDLLMPEDLNGRACARKLRETNPQFKVVYMSGYSADLAGPGAELRLGENFLQKPIQPDRLLELLRRQLDP